MLAGRKLAHLQGRHIGTLNVREAWTFVATRTDPITPEPRWRRQWRFVRWLLFDTP